MGLGFYTRTYDQFTKYQALLYKTFKPPNDQELHHFIYKSYIYKVTLLSAWRKYEAIANSWLA